jgi:hypothetical protein
VIQSWKASNVSRKMLPVPGFKSLTD